MSVGQIQKLRAELDALKPQKIRRTKKDLEAEKHLREFVKLAWPYIDPHPLIWGKHLDILCDHLAAVTEGSIKNLLINVPPRTGKSTITAILWPAWQWIRSPETQFLTLSYASALAIRDAAKARALMESPWYQARWGHIFGMKDDQNLKTRYENSRHGYRIASGVLATVTGDGGDVVLIDDPHNVGEAESDVIREGTIEWYDTACHNRVNSPKSGRRIIIGQRVHERDLSAHVLRRGGWEHLNLTMEFEPAKRCSTSIGWTDWRTEPGQLLWPEHFGADEIAELKAGTTSVAWSAQYQQQPTPPGGTLFKSSWLRYWRKSEDGTCYLLLEKNGGWKSVEISKCRRFAFMDVAGTEKSEKSRDPDFSVVQVWDVTPENEMVLVDQFRAQAEIPAVQDATGRIVRLHDVPYILVEQNNLGQGVAQTLKLAGLAVKPIIAKGDKVSRSQTAQIRMEQGTIYFPDGPEWVKRDLEPELLKFPRVAHDDQVDVLSYSAQHVQQMSAGEIEIRVIVPAPGPMRIGDRGQDMWTRIA